MPQILVVAGVISEVGKVGEDLLLGVCNGKAALGPEPRGGRCRTPSPVPRRHPAPLTLALSLLEFRDQRLQVP